MSPLSPASTAPARAVCSHGWATAVGTGSRPRHLASSASYFPVPGVRSMVLSCSVAFRPPNRPSGFLQEERQKNGEADSEQQRRERRLVVFELHLRKSAAGAQHDPAEYRRQQRAEGEVQEVD